MTEFGKNLDKALRDIDLSEQIPLPEDASIPTDPQAFYADFGYLRHPATRSEVKSLAQYQIEVWRSIHENKRTLVIKSNKIGITTSVLLADFQLAVLPSTNPLSTRGFDTLVIAQTLQHSREHLKTLHKLIASSSRYQGFLISRPEEVGLRDEQSKSSILYLKNPDNPSQPSRIIGLGLNNAGSIASWKNVRHIHVSDATATDTDITEAMSYAETRLANTNGSMIIETIPSGPEGYIYDLFVANSHSGSRWKLFQLPAEQAVNAGVIDQKFLESERASLGVLFPRYYGAEFVSGEGNIFDLRAVNACIQDYPLTMGDGRKILAIDPAFGSSKFGIVGCELNGGMIFVREATQFSRPSIQAMVEHVTRLYRFGGYSMCLVDGSQSGFITDLSKNVRTDRVNFGEKLQDLVWSTNRCISEGKVRIHPKFNELANQLKQVTFDKNGNPDKTKGSSLDLVDAFMMAILELYGSGERCGAVMIDPDGYAHYSDGRTEFLGEVYG